MRESSETRTDVFLAHVMSHGRRIAKPYVSPFTGAAALSILKWEPGSPSEKGGLVYEDVITLAGNYRSVHDIPMNILDSKFFREELDGRGNRLAIRGSRFSEGNFYRRMGTWDFPFLGSIHDDFIGCWVEAMRPPVQIRKPREIGESSDSPAIAKPPRISNLTGWKSQSREIPAREIHAEIHETLYEGIH